MTRRSFLLMAGLFGFGRRCLPLWRESAHERWYAQVLRRYNDAIAADRVIPFRLV